MFENGLFIFHRDFRLIDNIGLLQCSRLCKKIFCCFIFTPEQVGQSNKYRSKNAILFMIESLVELSNEIQKQNGELILLYGSHTKSIHHIIKQLNIQCVVFNKDYSPYAVKRDEDISNLCKTLKIECKMCSDYYLYEPGTIKTTQGNFYKKYTPFYEAVIDLPVDVPTMKKTFHFEKTYYKFDNNISLEDAYKLFTKENNDILVRGGRTNALIRLNDALKKQKQYETMRDYLTYNTTFLSAYIKFGCISIREAYHKFYHFFGKKCGLIRELIWREFFANILYAFPEVVGQSYVQKYRAISWRKSDNDFELWKKGKTGFPIVDAGMRQLNKTGYMHNRVRMMVASFLIKVLLLDWRLGEQYFAQKLTDYDIASNNGNWQGISGTGVDMKPYFRDMNPWIQSYKFDIGAEYIKKWVPELKDVEPKDIHEWHTSCKLDKYKSVNYPCPMVNYIEQKQKMLELYKNV